MTKIKFRSDMKVDYIDHMGTDETVTRAARVSLGEDQLAQGKLEGLIGYLVREGHTSTLEHTAITIRAEVPIFVHRQIMTHRTLCKNSESGRYTEFKPEFYVPDNERPLINSGSSARPELVAPRDSRTIKLVQNAHVEIATVAWDIYSYLISGDPRVDDVTANEVARNVLPVSTYTSLWMTGNLHAWFNFLRLRDGREGHPQYEVVDVAKQVAKIVGDLFPITFNAREETYGKEV